MNLNEQKLLVETLVSSPEVFARCIGILRPDYFDLEYQGAVKYLIEYYGKYNGIPSMKSLRAKYPAHDYEDRGFVSTTEEESICDDVELFCRQRALYDAIRQATVLIADNNHQSFEKVEVLVQNALQVSLVKDLGMDMFDDPYNSLMSMKDTQQYEPTGLAAIDDALKGLARKQTTLFSANSGGGKSVMMANIGVKYANVSKLRKNPKGMHVVLISLELSEEMIFIRNSAIMSGYKAATWEDNIEEIADTIEDQKRAGGGSFVIKRLPNGSSANDMRAYLKQYEVKYQRRPDVIIVDYLDLMSPNGGGGNMNISEQDKYKSEQLAELGHTYNAIIISASQQNRDAIKEKAAPDQSVIAGGLTKVNTVDNYISILMTPEMRLQGFMNIYFLKTRSSSAVGSMAELDYNAETLQIADRGSLTNRDNLMRGIRQKRANEALDTLAAEGGELPNSNYEPNLPTDDGFGGLASYESESQQEEHEEQEEDPDTPPWDALVDMAQAGAEQEPDPEPVEQKQEKPEPPPKPPKKERVERVKEEKPKLQIMDDEEAIDTDVNEKKDVLKLDQGRSTNRLLNEMSSFNTGF